VNYEELSGNPRTVTRRILEHCGLCRQDNCLNVHSLASAVTTASASDVRRPLYSDSVERWRHYKKELEPLIRQLKVHCVALG